MTENALVGLFKNRRLDDILNELPSIIFDKWLDEYILVTMLTTEDVIILYPGIKHIFIAEPDYTFTVVPFLYRNTLRFETGFKYLDDSNEKYAAAYNSSVTAGNSIEFVHLEDGLQINTSFPSTKFDIYRGEKKVPALIFKRIDIKHPVEYNRFAENNF